MENKDLKDFIREFWQNELEEIRKNKFRVAALVLFSLAAIFFVLTDGEEEKIDLNETSQVEQIEEQEKVSSKEKKSSDKKVIVVKKDKSESKSGEKNISVVIGANADDLYIRDPFASEESFDVALKEEVETIPATPPQIPPIPSNSPQNLPKVSVPSDLPPIPSQIPILPEISPPQPSEKFILTGTAIGANKNAIVKKVSTSQGKDYEENIIVGVGDYVQGRQIVDITGNALIFSDNQNPMYMSGFDDLSVNLSVEEDTNLENLSNHDEENIISDDISKLEKETITIEKQVSTIEIAENVPVEYETDQKNILPSDKKSLINPNTNDNFADFNSDDFSVNNENLNSMSGIPPSSFENLSLEK